ncbi:MAG: rRNA maturation RNase YbeY [Succinivibrio sp.]|nr:rRNA maturation RNase YbeY [Succinivibrio sp.]
MPVELDLQLALEHDREVPELSSLKLWAETALKTAGYEKPSEITVRLVESAEIQELNRTYRKLDRPTNILSFPFECPDEVELPLLGDLVICDEILRREAQEQQKSYEEHFAHLIIHGTLHLLGYDHIEDKDAEEMESLETQALAALGYPDPYLVKD